MTKIKIPIRFFVVTLFLVCAGCQMISEEEARIRYGKNRADREKMEEDMPSSRIHDPLHHQPKR